jgi:hypothetical protein
MTVPFAKGRYAFGFCDRCGFRADLAKLFFQPVKGRNTNLKVCRECLDKDHPQLFLGMFPINDPQALFNPRPDTGKIPSEALFGWQDVTALMLNNSVGGIVGNNAVYIQGIVGSVIVLNNGQYDPNI